MAAASPSYLGIPKLTGLARWLKERSRELIFQPPRPADPHVAAALEVDYWAPRRLMPATSRSVTVELPRQMTGCWSSSLSAPPRAAGVDATSAAHSAYLHVRAPSRRSRTRSLKRERTARLRKPTRQVHARALRAGMRACPTTTARYMWCETYAYRPRRGSPSGAGVGGSAARPSATNAPILDQLPPPPYHHEGCTS